MLPGPKGNPLLIGGRDLSHIPNLWSVGHRRLTEWFVANGVLSPRQKGFLPADGAFEHVHTLNRVLEKARKSKSDKCVA
ncbi:Reverse transcriptase domain-containing protein [Aphis craccivora]|uniref:Reverse transcriptase domain-containing protein n=1 Tax=Aphis craccivora TaxID=307492 RepID=A0A6G0X1F5_APHCR|nr:Reverse transcriptase domain-containing protein [Aphis craccivora]